MRNQLKRAVLSCLFMLFLLSFELIGQWKQVNGPYLGDVQKIVFKGNNFYALVFKAGIYKSTDEGNNWIPLNNGINPGMILDITANDKKVFVATNDGLFVLSDNETVWNRSTLATLSCNRLCCSGDTIYVGDGEGGVYASKDGGSTWSSKVLAQSGYIFGMTAGKNIAFTSKDQNEINYSTDCGASWSKAKMGPISSFSEIQYKNSRLYLVNDYGVFSTRNKGEEWEWIKEIKNARRISVDGNNMAILAEKLHLSNDTGKTWKIIDLSSIYNTSVIARNNQIFLLNYKDGISRSVDQGTTWNECNNGINGAYVKSFAKYKNELVVCANGRIYNSPDFGKTWKFTGFRANWITNFDTLLLASNFTLDFIVKKKDNTWSKVKSRLTSIHGLYKSYVQGSTIYVGEGFFLLKSNDGGEKWDTIFNYLKVPGKVGNSFGLEDILVDGNNIFIAGGDGGLFRSTDKGISWNQIRTETCSAIKKNGNKILIGTNSGIFSSSNNGDTWVTLKLVFGVKYIEIFRNCIIMTAYDAIYASFDEGVKWRSFGTIPQTPLCLSTFSVDSTVFCGLYSYGIYNRPLKDILTFKAEDKTRFYGGNNPEFTFTVTGFTNGDNISALAVLPTGSTKAVQASETGIYPITLAGGKDSAYHYVYLNGNLTVKKATLTVQVNNKTKKYSEANPPFDFSYLGFVNGENESVIDVKPVVASMANESSSPGSYSIIASGGSDNNYEFIYTNGTLSITSITNIPNVDGDTLLQVFPNPAVEVITIRPRFDKEKVVKVFSIDGKLMIEKVFTGDKIEISTLPSGVYYLKIDNNIVKFVKS